MYDSVTDLNTVDRDPLGQACALQRGPAALPRIAGVHLCQLLTLYSTFLSAQPQGTALCSASCLLALIQAAAFAWTMP